MAKSTTFVVVMLAVLAVTAIIGVGYFVYSDMQQTALQEEEAEKAAVEGPTTLQGKAATVSTVAYDKAADVASTQAAAPLYLIVGNSDSPITATADSITGESFAADNSSLSTSTTTDTTSGVNVGDTIIGIASNNTWYGAPGAVETIDSQNYKYDVDVYRVATNGGKVTWYDEDDNSFTNSTSNITVAASQEYTFSKLKIENNVSNRAWNIAGFYLQEPTGTNITSYALDGTTSGDYEVGISKDSTAYSLESRDNVDVVFALDEAVLLLEYDKIYTPSLTVEADGDGCNTGEEMAKLKVFDANWYRSNKQQAMLFGAEDDKDSPADIGGNDLIADIVICA